MSPLMLCILNSKSRKRRAMPAQCTVLPPTALTIQAGRLGLFSARCQPPAAMRLSSQEIFLNIAHSSFSMSSRVKRLPASSTTLRIFCLASALARVPPPAPEPMITTTLSSSWANVAMGYFLVLFLFWARRGSGRLA